MLTRDQRLPEQYHRGNKYQNFRNSLGNMNNSKFLLVRLKLPIHTGEVENPNLFTGGKTGQKKAPLQFHDDQELKLKWIYFVNRKYWLPTAHSVICIDLFEDL